MIGGKVTDKTSLHYVHIDEKRCVGCVLCMKACPTKAIRVRGLKVAKIVGTCVDCGECIRVCPHGAVKATTTRDDYKAPAANMVISASPVLYSQFGQDVLPEDIQAALQKTFEYVFDQTYFLDLYNVALEIFIKETSGKEDSSRPLISPVCPVVNRLIAYRFPALLKNLSPILTPRELAARELKRRIEKDDLLKKTDYGVYHITPCSAKMISINNPMFLKTSYLDGAIGINDVFESVKRNLPGPDETSPVSPSNSLAIGWGISGGEIAAMGEGNYMAVSGLPETIRYLEKIEMGLFRDIEYFEFRACLEGCIGGPLTVADRYEAKRTVMNISRMFSHDKRIRYAQAEKAYRKGWFFSEKRPQQPEEAGKRSGIIHEIERQEKIAKIMEGLPGKECGFCGSPGCRSFAEDVADGRAMLEECIRMRIR